MGRATLRLHGKERSRNKDQLGITHETFRTEGQRLANKVKEKER